MLCYHVEAKDYEHEGLVEEEMDVEKTQVDEQKVEKVFDDVPSPAELRQRPSCDESYEIPAPLDLLRDNKSSFKWRRIKSSLK